MKKFYYGPIVLGLAALAVGTQVSSVTTVLAGVEDGQTVEKTDETKDDTKTDESKDTVDDADAAAVEKETTEFKGNLGKLANSLKGINGSTPDTDTLLDRITYSNTFLSSDDSKSLQKLNDFISEMNDEVLDKRTNYSMNDVTLLIDDKEYTIKNVPIEPGESTDEINITDLTGLPSNIYLMLTETDSKITPIVCITDPDTKKTYLAVGHTASLVSVNKTADGKDINNVKTNLTQPSKPSKPDTGNTGNSHHSSGNSNNSNKDNNETKPEDTKTIVEHRTTFATSTTKNVPLYNDEGKLINDRALGKDSSWFGDKLMTLDGVQYIRVATNEWAKLDDGLEVETINTTVRTKVQAGLYTADGKKVTNRALAGNSDWFTDKSATINGQKMYRVSTNEWVAASDLK